MSVMSIKRPRALRLAAMVLTGLLMSAGACAALDADKNPDPNADRTVGSGTRSEESTVPQAPIGHRQPRAADLPTTIPRDSSDEWLDRVNRDIDRKLEICRGC
jgi:hypothetical protein